MGNWNQDKSADYEDYEDGLYDFDHGIPVEDRSTNLVDFSDPIFNPGRPNVWDRITGNTAANFLDRFTDDQMLGGNILGQLSRPVSGNTTVFDPDRGRGLEIIDHNKTMDLFGNAINTLANPLTGSVFGIDTARVRDPVTGQELNYESSMGYLGDSRIVSDAALDQERLLAQQNRQDRSDSNQQITPDNTGGLLATNAQGDIPWYVLANAGLLAV